MDQYARDYYSAYSDKNPRGIFHDVIILEERPELEWSHVSKLAPKLIKGWFELAHLPVQDRLEFIREFWLAKLPYCSHINEAIEKFFAGLGDIAVILTQKKYDDPYEPQLVYTASDSSRFFQGKSPATESEIIELQKMFPAYVMPVDYLAFLQIHNGFAKLTDTGVTQSSDMKASYDEFQQMLEKEYPLMTNTGEPVDPKSLIPFYKSFGMSFYQCFWGEWYPDQEMGNVYYSSSSKTISKSTKNDFIETMAFESFTDWLLFYLEKIE
jgi:hypothetical protein